MKRRDFLLSTGSSAAVASLSKMRLLSSPLASRGEEAVAAKGSSSELRLATIHWQFEFPAWVSEAGQHFDVKEVIAGMVDAGVEAVHFMISLEPGIYHFNTKIGFQKDHLNRDLLREFLDEIKRQGVQANLKVFGYMPVSLTNAAVKQRPEWQQKDSEGRPLWLYDAYGQEQFAYMCVNTPFRGYSTGIYKEVADNYPGIFGFWLDEPSYLPQGCYCRWCREQFRDRYGYAIPIAEAPRHQRLELARFKHESLLRYFQDFVRKVVDPHPGMVWTWNGAGETWDPKLASLATFNSAEVQGGYLQALYTAKRFQSYRRPFELTWGDDYGWCDQRIRPEHEQKTFQAIALIHGGGELIGDYPYPDGRLRELKFDWCKGILHWKRAISEYLRGAESYSQVALFDSWGTRGAQLASGMDDLEEDETKYRLGRPTPFHPERGQSQPYTLSLGQRLFAFPPGPGQHSPRRDADVPLAAWVHLLGLANVQFDIASEFNLKELSRYKVIIVPDQLYLPPETVAALEKYVEEGGNLLVTYRSGLFNADGDPNADSSLGKLAGIRFVKFSSFRGHYIRVTEDRLKPNLPPIPLLVYGSAVLTEADSARSLAAIAFPLAELSPETRVWFDYNPAQPDSSPHPAISFNRYGKGQVMYVALPIEERWFQGSYWTLARLLLNMLDYLNNDRILRLQADREVRAFTTIQRQQHRVVLHLLNEGSWTQMVFSYFAGDTNLDSLIRNQTPYPWKQPLAKDVEVDVAVPFGTTRSVYIAPERTRVPFKFRDGRVAFTIPQVDTHTVVVIES